MRVCQKDASRLTWRISWLDFVATDCDGQLYLARPDLCEFQTRSSLNVLYAAFRVDVVPWRGYSTSFERILVQTFVRTKSEDVDNARESKSNSQHKRPLIGHSSWPSKIRYNDLPKNNRQWAVEISVSIATFKNALKIASTLNSE